MACQMQVDDLSSDIDDELVRAARELTARSMSHLHETLDEIADLERQLADLKRMRDGQLNAQHRLDTYRPKLRTSGHAPGRQAPDKPTSGPTSGHVCPNCWVVEGHTVLLQHVSFEALREDVMRCPNCGRDFGIPPSR